MGGSFEEVEKTYLVYTLYRFWEDKDEQTNDSQQVSVEEFLMFSVHPYTI